MVCAPYKSQMDHDVARAPLLHASKLAGREGCEDEGELAEVGRNVVAVAVEERLPVPGRVHHVDRVDVEVDPPFVEREFGHGAAGHPGEDVIDRRDRP